MIKQWTIIETMNWTEERLAKQGEENPRLAAQMLAAHATGLSRIELYTNFDKPLSENERTILRNALQRRLDGEPLQYILGSTGFRYLELKVRPPVLIPRPETESLVELVLLYAQEKGSNAPRINAPRILEIGTGTGAIALSLVHELPACHVTATDIDDAAVELARQNAGELKMDDAQHLRILKDDVASSLLADTLHQGTFDVVVSNPPYIPTDEYEGLPTEILQFESRAALDGGADGLDLFRKIASQAAILLKPGGLLAVELHESALKQAADIALSLPYQDVQIHDDLTERQRFLTAVRSMT